MSTTELVKLSAAEMAAKIKAKEVSSRELVEAHLAVIESAEPSVKAFLKVSADQALEQADAFDAKSDEDKAQMPELAGVPIAIKDMIVTKGIETTAASKILEGWVPPYDATVIEKLKAAGMPILGKTNLDEFAQGSSTEHSAYQTTHNPWDTERVPGGSGGGSASAVAAFEAPIALGTDTGGSIRQPGALTGTAGVPPTAASPVSEPSPWPPRSTRSARSPAPCSTPHCCRRSSVATTSVTPPPSPKARARWSPPPAKAPSAI